MANVETSLVKKRYLNFIIFFIGIIWIYLWWTTMVEPTTEYHNHRVAGFYLIKNTTNLIDFSRKKEQSGKKVELKGYEVVFEDTVFFPEGGGQNTDLGLVGDDNQVEYIFFCGAAYAIINDYVLSDCRSKVF